MISKHSAIAWLIVVIVLLSIATYYVTYHWRTQTDILALFPQNGQEPIVHTFRQMVSGELGRTALFLVSHPQPEIARHATRQLGQLMDASSLFAVVRWDHSQYPKMLFEFYFPFRYRIISSTVRHYLDQEDGYRYLLDHLKRELYHPMASFTARTLAEDPLLMFNELMKDFGKTITHLNPMQGMNEGDKDKSSALHRENLGGDAERRIKLEDGMIGTTFEGRHYYFIIARLASNPFEETTQVQLENNWHEWSNQLRQASPGLELTYTAAARFASSMRDHMQRDILFVSIGSTIGVGLIIILVFRSPKQLLIALIPLVIGLWTALGLSLLIFEELHAFTLVFGASLIGICIDYSMHYFVYHRFAVNWAPITTMHHIFPALGLGALTTIVSFIGLGLTPLIGLRQIAIFASLGIFVSVLTVIFWFPFLLQAEHPLASYTPKFYPFLRRFLRIFVRNKKYLCISLVIIILLSVKGISDLHISDSPIALKTFPSDLTTEDRLVRDITGVSESQRYLIIEGKNAEEVLQRLEAFQDYMGSTDLRYGAELGPMITSFIPSKKRQEENVRSVRKLLMHEQEISNEMAALGLPETIIKNFFMDLKREPGVLLSPDMWLNHSVSSELKNFWLDILADRPFVVVRLQNVTDVQSIKDLISSFEGIGYFDHIGDLTRILESYRKNIMVLVIGAHAVIFALLFWRYHLKGFFVILPPLIGASLTVGILGFLGRTFHLLHCLSLLLVLGMGVDYAIFLAESDPSAQPKTFLAATLATVTTVLSFGLLSFSSQEALQAIGLTTFVGISCVWLLSPIAMYGRSRP